jgi:hypothetical protein
MIITNVQTQVITKFLLFIRFNPNFIRSKIVIELFNEMLLYTMYKLLYTVG